MEKRNVVNIILLVTVIALLATGAMFVRIKPTADSVAVLSMAGMTCGRCASAIERSLQAQNGVAAVEVDVKGGRVIVAYDSKTIRPAVISSAVACLGYRSSVAECLSAEQFRKLTGRDPGMNGPATGCGGCCNIVHELKE
jgi:mercuric ion binding protein